MLEGISQSPNISYHSVIVEQAFVESLVGIFSQSCPISCSGINGLKKSRRWSGIGLQVANIGYSQDIVSYKSLVSDPFLAKSLEPLFSNSILSLDMFCHGSYEAVKPTVQILL